MQRLAYPVDILEEPEGITVTFPDLPEAITCGETRDDALFHATDALETVLEFYVAEGKAIPVPSEANGRPLVYPDTSSAAKTHLYIALKDKNITKTELARRLNWKYPQVDRLFKFSHHSRLDQLDAAFKALNRRIVINDMSFDEKPV